MATEVSQHNEDSLTHDFGRVRSAVASLERAMRSHRVNEGQGPTVEEHIAAATRLFAELLKRGPVTLRVSSFGLLYKNRTLMGSRKIDDSWFGLFADSVRDLTFEPGVSDDEMRTFIEVLCGEPEEGDDRVTLLWRREVHRIQLYISSLLPTRLEPGEDGDIRLVSEKGIASLFEPPQDAPGTPALAFSRQDPRSLVGREELSWIASAQSQPFEVEPWVEAALSSGGARARGDDVQRFVEAIVGAGPGEAEAGVPSLLVALLDTLLCRDPQGWLLPLLNALVAQDTAVARPIQAHLAHPEFLVRLAPLCDMNPGDFEQVIGVLGEVDPDGLSAFLVALRSPMAQTRFARLAGDAGGDVLPLYLQQLDSEDEQEVLSTVEALRALSGERGLPGLEKALRSRFDRVRYQALRALEGQNHPSLFATLVEVLDDPRRVHRLQALRMLGTSAEPIVVQAVADRVQRPEFLERDPAEQTTWLRSLAGFPDEETIEAYRHLLGLRSLARKPVTDMQLQVVEHLAKMQFPGGRQLLSGAKGGWQLARSVRKAIATALKGGTNP